MPFLSLRLPAAVAALGAAAVPLVAASAPVPTFSNVTVHDPSVVRDGGHWYVFGSHLASARTADGLHWTQLSTDPVQGNPLVPDPDGTFAEVRAWVGGENAFWAPDVIQLADGRYYYYYCIGRLDQPRAALGVAVADTITGPYENEGVILRSGMWGEISPDGTVYDATRHPNAVDPDVFFDQTGRLWMVYGSYSGGIFILELDPANGRPLPGQGYGRKLIGGQHARIEGAFMLYSPESAYYYLFLSFGGLAADGGYNIRVARSRQPDGPFFDAAGNELTHVAGTPGTLFDDAAISPYGVTLMGNYQFNAVPGEPSARTRGYVSPGHNSAYYDPFTGQHFLVFHTRFVGRGEEHEVRVHQLYMNADEWLVAAPHRYAGETLQRYGVHQIPGDYKVIRHGRDISAEVRTSELITLRPNRRIEGAGGGSWRLSGDADLTLTLDGTTYRGVVSTQWDDDQGAWVYAFSALSAEGEALWGSRTVVGRQPPRVTSLRPWLALLGETLEFQLPRPRGNPSGVFSYALVDGPAGLTVDRASGRLSWRPTLTQVDIPYPVTVVAVETSPDHPRQTHYTFPLTAVSAHAVRRLDLDFNAPGAGGLADAAGVATGLTSRLPGTGALLPAADPHLRLVADDGVLELQSARADFHGQAGMDTTSAPGVALAGLGFTGTEDFAVVAIVRPLAGLEFIDQVGLYVGADSATMTRAGTIVFGAPERYATHTRGGFDADARFLGFGLDVSDGMIVTVGRDAGTWQSTVDGVEWSPLTPPAFLEGRADLVAGVFAIHPLNDQPKTVRLDALSVVVATNEPQLTPLEVWRVRHFGQVENAGVAADRADPDRDRVRNQAEFENGTDPRDPRSY